MQKLISVIIPVYNHAHTLLKSLDSLKSQTYTNWEAIVVNDGSTDNFEEVVARACHSEHPQGVKNPLNSDTAQTGVKEPFTEFTPYSDTGLRMTNGVEVKVINLPNRGAPAARNRGFKEAKGEYVIFWDADTIARPETLEKMIGMLEKNPDKNYVYCDYKFGWKKMKSRAFDGNALKENNYIDTTTLLRASDFVGFDENLKRFQDWDLWLTLLEKNKIGVYLPECLFKKIVHGRKGYSQWLPSFFYKLPWKTKKVKKYEEAREIVFKKHNLWI